MPVMGPYENQEEVDKAYTDVLSLLKDKYRIQNDETFGPFREKYSVMRQERNNHLREAVRLLFQLDSWESF